METSTKVIKQSWNNNFRPVRWYEFVTPNSDSVPNGVYQKLWTEWESFQSAIIAIANVLCVLYLSLRSIVCLIMSLVFLSILESLAATQVKYYAAYLAVLWICYCCCIVSCSLLQWGRNNSDLNKNRIKPAGSTELAPALPRPCSVRERRTSCLHCVTQIKSTSCWL